MAKSDDFMLRILLAIIVLVVFMRTLSVKRAREFKRTYNEVMQILSENVSQNNKKASNKNVSSEEKSQEAQQSSKKSSNMSGEEKSRSSKEATYDSYKKSQSSNGVAFLTLDDELKAKIVKNLKYKHYMLARKMLERAGYTNVSIKRVRNMILIETDQGRTVLTID
jgi:hypothetical protein